MSIDGFEDVPVNNEAALMKAVSTQPVSVAICASEAMQFYSSGVIAGEGSCTGLNHGVLAAGYDKAGLPKLDIVHEMRRRFCMPNLARIAPLLLLVLCLCTPA